MDSLKISTGEKRIAIERDGQNVGEIVFNPSDVLFAEKVQTLYAELTAKMDEYEKQAEEIDKHVELDENKIPVNAGERIAFVRDICEYMKSKIDDVFDPGTSQIAFGDALNIEMLYQFLDGMSQYIAPVRAAKIAKYVTPAKPKKRK